MTLAGFEEGITGEYSKCYLVHLELETGKVPFEPTNDMVRFHVKCQSFFFFIDKHVKFGFVRQKDMYLILRAIF